jgi:hypothetical protein
MENSYTLAEITSQTSWPDAFVAAIAIISFAVMMIFIAKYQ